jgi:hypothetical protein
MPFIAPTDRRNSLHYTRERQCRRSNHDVRFGSKADVTLSNFDVRFTPNNGHPSAQSKCPLWAKNGHAYWYFVGNFASDAWEAGSERAF